MKFQIEIPDELASKFILCCKEYNATAEQVITEYILEEISGTVRGWEKEIEERSSLQL